MKLSPEIVMETLLKGDEKIIESERKTRCMNKWEIVSDLVRSLAEYNDLGLNDSEAEVAHNDLANIMDYMITQNCGFKKALALYRAEDDDRTELTGWVNKALPTYFR